MAHLDRRAGARNPRKPKTTGSRTSTTLPSPCSCPPPEKASGAAVIVVPGGGHRLLVFNAEGRDPAQFLASLGIVAFALKYRLAREDGSTYSVARDARGDTYRALRLVRSRAAEWHIDPARIGVMGFSAGGELAGLVAFAGGEGDPAAPDPIDRVSGRPRLCDLRVPGTACRAGIGTEVSAAGISRRRVGRSLLRRADDSVGPAVPRRRHPRRSAHPGQRGTRLQHGAALEPGLGPHMAPAARRVARRQRNDEEIDIGFGLGAWGLGTVTVEPSASDRFPCSLSSSARLRSTPHR